MSLLTRAASTMWVTAKLCLLVVLFYGEGLCSFVSHLLIDWEENFLKHLCEIRSYNKLNEMIDIDSSKIFLEIAMTGNCNIHWYNLHVHFNSFCCCTLSVLGMLSFIFFQAIDMRTVMIMLFMKVNDNLLKTNKITTAKSVSSQTFPFKTDTQNENWPSPKDFTE